MKTARETIVDARNANRARLTASMQPFTRILTAANSSTPILMSTSRSLFLSRLAHKPVYGVGNEGSLFGLSGANAIKLNESVYANGKPDPATGVPGLISPDQVDFLTEEPGCQRHGVGIVSRPVNCASIGGKAG